VTTINSEPKANNEVRKIGMKMYLFFWHENQKLSLAFFISICENTNFAFYSLFRATNLYSCENENNQNLLQLRNLDSLTTSIALENNKIYKN